MQSHSASCETLRYLQLKVWLVLNNHKHQITFIQDPHLTLQHYKWNSSMQNNNFIVFGAQNNHSHYETIHTHNVCSSLLMLEFISHTLHDPCSMWMLQLYIHFKVIHLLHQICYVFSPVQHESKQRHTVQLCCKSQKIYGQFRHEQYRSISSVDLLIYYSTSPTLISLEMTACHHNVPKSISLLLTVVIILDNTRHSLILQEGMKLLSLFFVEWWVCSAALFVTRYLLRLILFLDLELKSRVSFFKRCAVKNCSYFT